MISPHEAISYYPMINEEKTKEKNLITCGTYVTSW